MKIALVDDERKFFNQFIDCLPDGVKENSTIDLFDGPMEDLLLGDFDIIFLDIMLNNKESFDFGQRLKDSSIHTTLVYISNFDHFVYESLRQDIFFFVRKKHLKEDLDEFFKKYDKIKQKHSETLTVRLPNCSVDLPQCRIIYLESQRNKLLVYTNDELYHTYISLVKVYPKLNQKVFYRLNGHIILNLDHVVRVEKDYILMSNNEKIPFTRNSKKAFLEFYVQYMEKNIWN